MPLMKDDKKKVAALIIRKMNGSEDMDSMRESNENMSQVATNEQGEEMDANPGLVAASEEIMAAVKSDNKKGLMGALKSFIEMAMMKNDND